MHEQEGIIQLSGKVR